MAVDVRSKDPDLGLTIALWIADLLEDFLDRNPSERVVIDDGGGRDVAARRDERGHFHVACPPSSVVFPPRPVVATLRKLLVRAGAARDFAPLDARRVIRHQQRIRQIARSALGVTRDDDRCRFVLRVDDFPSPFAPPDRFARFHEVAREHGIPYLLAVTPFLDRGEPGRLSDEELGILQRCAGEGAEVALHGFSHRSRYGRRRTELVGMPAGDLREELARADAYLSEQDLRPIGFVAPYNSYDAKTIPVLAERFPIICGGPESIAALGLRAGPSFLRQSLYVPSYRGAYDLTAGQIDRFDRLIGEARGLTLPLTLHWANEVRDELRGFRALCRRLAGATLRWSDLVARAAEVRAVPRPA